MFLDGCGERRVRIKIVLIKRVLDRNYGVVGDEGAIHVGKCSARDFGFGRRCRVLEAKFITAKGNKNTWRFTLFLASGVTKRRAEAKAATKAAEQRDATTSRTRGGS